MSRELKRRLGMESSDQVNWRITFSFIAYRSPGFKRDTDVKMRLSNLSEGPEHGFDSLPICHPVRQSVRIYYFPKYWKLSDNNKPIIRILKERLDGFPVQVSKSRFSQSARYTRTWSVQVRNRLLFTLINQIINLIDQSFDRLFWFGFCAKPFWHFVIANFSQVSVL